MTRCLPHGLDLESQPPSSRLLISMYCIFIFTGYPSSYKIIDPRKNNFHCLKLVRSKFFLMLHDIYITLFLRRHGVIGLLNPWIYGSPKRIVKSREKEMNTN